MGDNGKRAGGELDARPGDLGARVNLGYTGTVQTTRSGKLLGI
jgi:hypothetical protein